MIATALKTLPLVLAVVLSFSRLSRMRPHGSGAQGRGADTFNQSSLSPTGYPCLCALARRYSAPARLSITCVDRPKPGGIAFCRAHAALTNELRAGASCPPEPHEGGVRRAGRPQSDLRGQSGNCRRKLTWLPRELQRRIAHLDATQVVEVRP